MNKRSLHIVWGAVAVAVAVAIPCVSWLAPRVSRPKAAGVPPARLALQTNLVAGLQQKLAQRSREVAQLKTENLALWEGLSNAVAMAIAPAPKDATAEDAARRVSAEIHKRISTMIRRAEGRRLAALTVRLHLSDQQTKTTLEALEKDYEEAMAVGDRKRLDNSNDSLGRILKPILMPEQWTGYQQYRTEERSQVAQSAALYELSQWSLLLQLSPQQQEQISPILQQQHAAQQEVSDPAALDQILDDKMKALRAVLTPEQQQGYEKIIQTERETNKIMSNLGNGLQDQPPAP